MNRTKPLIIPIMGTLAQSCLGTVYAWSFFQKPIMNAYHWSNTQTMWIFSLSICFLGLAAAWAGMKLDTYGPRKLAVAGGLLYGTGWIVGALAMKWNSLPLFYAGFGAVGGVGLGLGYVTPVATSVKWFPEKKGLVTGFIVMGFGFGALFMSKLIAPFLLRLSGGDLPLTFLAIGIFVGAVASTAGSFMQNPPMLGKREPVEKSAIKRALLSRNFVFLWIAFFANICAGMMFLGLQSPMLQSLLSASASASGLTVAQLAAAGASLIAASSLFNGIGRLFWGAISDKIGRLPSFRLIMGTQIAAFICLLFVRDPLLFAALVCYVLLCYGGGFGVMPSTATSLFGAPVMPIVYGTLLSAWSAGGIVGPQIAAAIADSLAAKNAAATGAAGATYAAGIAFLLLGLFFTLFLRDAKQAPR